MYWACTVHCLGILAFQMQVHFMSVLFSASIHTVQFIQFA